MVLRTQFRLGSIRRHMVLTALFVNLVVIAAGSVAIALETSKPVKIIAFGDSLTAGYGLNPSDAFPAQLERALQNRNHKVDVINAGVSGDTTGAGLARLDWVIPNDADAVILALGANDALRGQNPDQTRKNLETILSKLTTQNIDVLVAGMAAPRSLGKTYVKAFDPIFEDLSKKYNQLYYPFFLDGVALDPKLNQPDGLHPTAQGIAVIVERILPTVEKLLARVEQRVAKTE